MLNIPRQLYNLYIRVVNHSDEFINDEQLQEMSGVKKTPRWGVFSRKNCATRCSVPLTSTKKEHSFECSVITTLPYIR